jgi:hypothetical protein
MLLDGVVVLLGVGSGLSLAVRGSESDADGDMDCVFDAVSIDVNEALDVTEGELVEDAVDVTASVGEPV